MKLETVFVWELAVILIASLAYCVDSKAESTIYAGIGIHGEKYDCPEVCYGGDTLAIVEYTYRWKYTAFKAIHISNPIIKEKGYGTNAVFYGIYYTFK